MVERFRTSDIRVKDADKAKIYDILFHGEAKSRKELLDRFKFRPTVLTLAIRELLEDGLITEEAKRKAVAGGRPEVKLAPEPDRLMAICFHAESRHLKAALVNLKGDILLETGKEFMASSDGEAFLELCRNHIRELKAYMPKKAMLAGIGMSLPGSVDTKEKRFNSTYRWPRVRNLGLQSLENEFGCSLHVRKDLDSVLENSMLNSPELAKGNTLLFHWGFGVGFAFAQNGRNVNNESSRFGEVGHTRVDLANVKPCICGSAGCIETDTAIWALLPSILSIDKALYDDEQLITDFCRKHPEVAILPAVREALRTVSLTMMNMYRIFFPSNVLFLGPFFHIPSITQSLEERIILETSTTGYPVLGFRVIEDGYRGCIYSNARHVFAIKLADMLRAKF
ncbi:MAG: ROK family protein [Spirochaetia bacterium]|jgi:transcriptional regulator of PTS gene|nr:ROK family protein [Spirochaetia bacterium]